MFMPLSQALLSYPTFLKSQSKSNQSKTILDLEFGMFLISLYSNLNIVLLVTLTIHKFSSTLNKIRKNYPFRNLK